MRLVGQLAQLRVALALRRSGRVDGRLARSRGLLLLRRDGGLSLELLVGALDRALDQLAVPPRRGAPAAADPLIAVGPPLEEAAPGSGDIGRAEPVESVEA